MKHESNLQRAVFQWLELHRIFAWRMPIGPVVHRKNTKHGLQEFWKKSPLKGFPDIAGVLRKKYPGVLFTLELKSSQGRLMEEQVHWMTDLQAAGARCALIRSIEDLESVMVRWGEIPPRSNPVRVDES